VRGVVWCAGSGVCASGVVVMGGGRGMCDWCVFGYGGGTYTAVR